MYTYVSISYMNIFIKYDTYICFICPPPTTSPVVVECGCLEIQGLFFLFFFSLSRLYLPKSRAHTLKRRRVHTRPSRRRASPPASSTTTPGWLTPYTRGILSYTSFLIMTPASTSIHSFPP